MNFKRLPTFSSKYICLLILTNYIDVGAICLDFIDLDSIVGLSILHMELLDSFLKLRSMFLKISLKPRTKINLLCVENLLKLINFILRECFIEGGSVTSK